MSVHTHYAVPLRINHRNYTYITPAAAGATALKIDIAAIEMPFAAPLWC